MAEPLNGTFDDSPSNNGTNVHSPVDSSVDLLTRVESIKDNSKTRDAKIRTSTRTSARYHREYRARKKREMLEKAEKSKLSYEIIEKRKKEAQRSREYRARKRANKPEEIDKYSESKTPEASNNNKYLTVMQLDDLRRKREAAAYQRIYRARKRLEKLNSLDSSNETSIVDSNLLRLPDSATISAPITTVIVPSISIPSIVTGWQPMRNVENGLATLENDHIDICNENVFPKHEEELNIDDEETPGMCEQLYRDEEMIVQQDSEDPLGQFSEQDPLNQSFVDLNSHINDDLRLADSREVQSIAIKTENLLSNDSTSLRIIDTCQQSLLLEIIRHLTSEQIQPLRIFITGYAGCEKTFVIHLILELYNKFATIDAHCNAYVTWASTGKASVRIHGTTVDTVLSLLTNIDNGLSEEELRQFQSLFQHIGLVIVDEISMIEAAEQLKRIDRKLRLITKKLNTPFGGLDIVLIGQPRLPFTSEPIFEESMHFIESQIWHSFQLYQLTEIMRQVNIAFYTILTKIKNRRTLNDEETTLIESRFFTEEATDELCPHGVRLAFSNDTINRYTKKVLERQKNPIVSRAIDVISDCKNDDERKSVQKELEEKNTPTDTGGLPTRLTLVIGQNYMLTKNIALANGLACGVMGKLNHIETNETGSVTRVWLLFTEKQTGSKARFAVRSFVAEKNINPLAVPISRDNSTIYMHSQRTISVNRNQFPLDTAWGMTIDKSKRSRFDEVVYFYEKCHSQQSVYVALSRATSIEGLFIIAVDKRQKFYHDKGKSKQRCLTLGANMPRLRINRPLVAIEQKLFDFLSSRKGLSNFSFNWKILQAHANELTNQIFKGAKPLMLSVSDNESRVTVPKFSFIVKFQRNEKRNSEVGIRHNKKDQYDIATTHMNIKAPYSIDGNVTLSSLPRVGDLCAVECHIPNNRGIAQKIVLIAIYITPKTSIHDIKALIGRSLLSLTVAGSQALSKILGEPVEDDSLPVILSGEFNLNFSLPEAKPLIHYFEENFALKMINGRNVNTSDKIIDTGFARNIDKIDLKYLLTNFSYDDDIVDIREELNGPQIENVRDNEETEYMDVSE